MTRAVTVFFGITPPKPEHEVRYVLIFLSLVIAMMLALVILFRVIVPFTLG
jgi:hypothetical protein